MINRIFQAYIKIFIKETENYRAWIIPCNLLIVWTIKSSWYIHSFSANW